MNKSIVIKCDTRNISLVEDFVQAVCDDSHVANYSAVVSVPIVRVVESLMQMGASDEVRLLFNYTRKGLTFTILCNRPCFFSEKGMAVQGGKIFSDELFYLVEMLSDDLSVCDGGYGLSISFGVRGIDAGEVMRRMRFLKDFDAKNMINKKKGADVVKVDL